MVRATVTTLEGKRKVVAFYGETLDEARENARKASQKPRTASVPVSVLIEAYRADVMPRRADKTREQFEWAVKHLEREFGLAIAQAVTKPQVYSWVKRLSASKLSGRSVQLLRNWLAQVFEYGVLTGLLKDNPAKGVPLVKSAKRKDPPRVTPEMAELVISKVEIPKYRAFFDMVYHAALRPHREGSQVKPDDCFRDGELGWIVVTGSKTEAGERKIPVPVRVYENALPFLPFDLDKNNVRREWGKACDLADKDVKQDDPQASVKRFPVKELRAVRYSVLVALVPKDVLTGVMGHTDPRTGEEHYARLFDKRVRDTFLTLFGKDSTGQV